MSRTLSTLASLLKIVCLLGIFAVVLVASGYYTVRWALSSEVMEVPDVVGRPAEEAERILGSRGLEVELEAQALPDEAIPEGHVKRQIPPAGSTIKGQRGILLTLSSGPPRRVVPDTAGDVFTQASIALRQHDISVEIARVHSDEVPEDRVLAQEPQPAELDEGQTAPARLLVSRGSRATEYVMPDLIGRPIGDVQRFLSAHGFRLAPIQERRQRGVTPGRVVQQEPSAGFKVRHGATIQLWVSS